MLMFSGTSRVITAVLRACTMLVLWGPVVTARTTVICGEILDNSIKRFYSVLTQLQIHWFLGCMFRHLQNHLQANVNYREIHSVCTHIMGPHSVYIQS